MTPTRRKRLYFVLAIVAGVSLAAWFTSKALLGNVMYSYNPTEISQGKAPPERRFRLLGMVEKGSIQQVPGTLHVKFLVTDYKHTLHVTYTGLLPDLFRDGQGVVAHGRLKDGIFVADEVLAKHDEKYMPPELAEALKNNPPPPELAPGT
jgi:cytochrome c-type biogenesis protein CcmE